MKLLLTNADGTFDITTLTGKISWSGDYQQCVRTLEFTMLSSATDSRVPVVACQMGNAVVFYVDGELRFSGFVVRRQKGTGDSVITVTCYDRGIYLKKNKASYTFDGQTPEAITKKLCADFGIPVGALAITGVPVTRNFFGSGLYDIIQTAYTLAAETTGEKYYQVFRGESLCVAQKTVGTDTLVIEGGANLMDASTTESIENLINQVVIYDTDNNYVTAVQDSAAIESFGLLQSYLKQSSDDDKLKQAQKLIDDNGVSQKITIQNLGNIRCVTGGMVIVREPYTGVYGLFYIDSDIHTWKNGQYYNKLTVNFKNIMDEKEAGSVIKSSSGASGSSGSGSSSGSGGAADSKRVYTYTKITSESLAKYKAGS